MKIYYIYKINKNEYEIKYIDKNKLSSLQFLYRDPESKQSQKPGENSNGGKYVDGIPYLGGRIEQSNRVINIELVVKLVVHYSIISESKRVNPVQPPNVYR